MDIIKGSDLFVMPLYEPESRATNKQHLILTHMAHLCITWFTIHFFGQHVTPHFASKFTASNHFPQIY